jgi:hypothetical protein
MMGTWLVAITTMLLTTITVTARYFGLQLWILRKIRSQSKIPLNPFGTSDGLRPQALLYGLKIPLQVLNDVCNRPYRRLYLIHSLIHRWLLTTREQCGFKIPLLPLL